MMRVLFVDDESRVLEGLRRSLRRDRDRWEMVYASGGEEALALVEAAPFDLVVSDMRMPAVDGCRVLGRTRELWPEATRVVLSGQTEHEAALRMVTVAHQFLAKPCEGERVRRLLERTEGLLALLPDARVRGLVGGIGCLETTPGTFAALAAALAAGHAVDDLAGLVRSDLVLSAKLLQIVGSAFFGLPRPIGSIQEAIAVLGTNLMRSLVERLAAETTTPHVAPEIEDFLLDEHAYGGLVASVARRVAEPAPWATHAFLGGLLHDIGTVVLASAVPAEYQGVIVEHATRRAPLHEVERQRLAIDHGAVGGWLAGTWGLPEDIVDAIAGHADPARAGVREWGPVLAVHAAQALVAEHQTVRLVPTLLDDRCLEAAGVADRLPAWRAIVEEELDRFEARRFSGEAR